VGRDGWWVGMEVEGLAYTYCWYFPHRYLAYTGSLLEQETEAI